MTREHAAAVRIQLQLARQAASRGAHDAARVALSQMRDTDFAGGPTVSAAHLAVLRDRGASSEAIREAVCALVALRPVGLR